MVIASALLNSSGREKLQQLFGNQKQSRMQKWRATRRLLLNSYSSKSRFDHPRSNPISDHSSTISRSSSGTVYIYIYNLLQLAHKNLKAIPSKCYAIYIFLGFESWTSRIHYRHFATAMIQRNPAFSSLNSDDINHFKGILGDKNVIEDEDALLFANTDWMRKYKGSSRLLLQPRTTQEVLYISFIN